MKILIQMYFNILQTTKKMSETVKKCHQQDRKGRGTENLECSEKYDKKTAKMHFRKRQEKSTVILVAIVCMFLLCHSYRLALKIYEFAKPDAHVMDSFSYCFQQNRYENTQSMKY